jgi:hypothetical protein
MITDFDVGLIDAGAVATNIFSLLAVRLIAAGCPSTVTEGE